MTTDLKTNYDAETNAERKDQNRRKQNFENEANIMQLHG